jgi:hypothetical protein
VLFKYSVPVARAGLWDYCDRKVWGVDPRLRPNLRKGVTTILVETRALARPTRHPIVMRARGASREMRKSLPFVRNHPVCQQCEKPWLERVVHKTQYHAATRRLSRHVDEVGKNRSLTWVILLKLQMYWVGRRLDDVLDTAIWWNVHRIIDHVAEVLCGAAFRHLF